jgi:hypothetical protein
VFVVSPPADRVSIVLATKNRGARAFRDDGDVRPKIVQEYTLLRETHPAVPDCDSHIAPSKVILLEGKGNGGYILNGPATKKR